MVSCKGFAFADGGKGSAAADGSFAVAGGCFAVAGGCFAVAGGSDFGSVRGTPLGFGDVVAAAGLFFGLIAAGGLAEELDAVCAAR